jgi:hypothetical protein
MVDKVYLGDGVYATLDPFLDLVLTTENGIEVTNQIALELTVLIALMRFTKIHWPELFEAL